ncbi:uncharacterized protein BJ212DRAFT_1482799 [Suillus subaureus]|uniref:PEHE domain-containing protein n=1 Tax=Suillus subaureus TaxID=48587 RepID=A0A9P7E7P7_9AGAM|nr:uncharacterized protein BJ212DRAFT_1482799 [Suillus subaureus]KAG1813345.1 hypothetical protein BJ212DRAFT_1482799 [Suillus subaureus]
MADSSEFSSLKPRQKRVLPSRSRRGGPGIGSCDVDLMILDAQRRRFENEPLIPANTQFLLTTNSALVPQPQPSSSTDFGLNSHANQRYFDRPDVIQAYREQQIIQTPEFTTLSEDASVGGRFRPRISAELPESADTSDAIYEKRHRKYETFEKRQRLREKEKLKHEQYKLKERIEQLRAMDGSAFLGLPAASFPLPSDAVQVEDSRDTSLTAIHVDGTVMCNEGERRRQEMLEVAYILEDRYRTLLPSDKKNYFDQRKASRQSSVNIPPSSDIYPQDESIINGRASATLLPTKASTSLVLKIKMPKQSSFSPSVSSTPAPKPTTYLLSSPSKSKSVSRASPAKPISRASSETESVESERPRKRARPSHLDEAYSPHSTPEHRAPRHPHPAPAPKPEPCVLMQAAIRASSAPTARKTHRHVTAFGTKVPQEIEELRDFELPEWIVPAQLEYTDSVGRTPEPVIIAEEQLGMNGTVPV